MTQSESNALVPKRRFPEFRNDHHWIEAPMGEIYTFKSNNSLSRDKLNYDTGTIKNIHYGDIHTKFPARFDIRNEIVPFINPSEQLNAFHSEDCVEGDMIFADASEDLKDIGKSIELVHLNGERVVAGLHTILARPDLDRLAIGFGAYLFQSRRVRAQIQKEAQGAKVLGISATRLSRIQLPLPPTKAEQQKIAACLSSLDDLIEAESRKLDALKAHKRGLMQRLFPREGETRPRLRFPEFCSNPNWQEATLGDVVDFESGGTPSKQNGDFWNGEIPWVTAKDMKQLFLEETEDHITQTAIRDGAKVAPARTVLMLTRGMTLFKDVPICILRRPMSFNQDVKALRTKGDVTATFLPFLLLANKQRLRDLVDPAGHGTGRLNTDDVKALRIRYPRADEQNRLSACFTSLELLIAAQVERLEALRTHKRGLMQELFPRLSGAEA